MATIAIDPTEIRTEPRPAEAPSSRSPRSKAPLVAGAVLLGLGGLGAAAFAALSYLPRPASLSGLSSVPPPAPARRSEIRFGPLPDMPEIRNGVPEVVGAKPPVRVIPTGTVADPGARPVSVPVPAPASPAAPISVVVPAAPPVPAAADVLASVVPPAPARITQPAPVVAPPPEPRTVEPPAAPIRSLVAAPPPASNSQPDPATTAALPTPTLNAPLPPPAPARTASRRQEVRTDRPVAGARQSAAVPGSAAASPQAAEKSVEAPADDRIEVLGMKLPNGRDIQEAMSSLGDAVFNRF